ncbi:unnamed protein product, partial [Meganyctiphanes norvegica]
MSHHSSSSILPTKKKKNIYLDHIKNTMQQLTLLASINGCSKTPRKYIATIKPCNPEKVASSSSSLNRSRTVEHVVEYRCDFSRALTCVTNTNEFQKFGNNVKPNSNAGAFLDFILRSYGDLDNLKLDVISAKTATKVETVFKVKVYLGKKAEKEEEKYPPKTKKLASGKQENGSFTDTVQMPAKKMLREDKEVKFEKREKKRDDDVMSLLSAQSIRERETKKVGEEIMELLSRPTAKEKSLTQRFRSQGGAKVQEFCSHGTKEECERANSKGAPKCGRLHFRKIIQKHTDESLGDCSFLNTCFHMDTCRYVHYEVDYTDLSEQQQQQMMQQVEQVALDQVEQQQSSTAVTMVDPRPSRVGDRTILFPPQWIQCDLRYLNMSVLGKFAVIMADPPWDIHMELPYGTMSDDEMRQLHIPMIQEEGLIFLWVTGRAMELGRECLKLWGYERVDEIIWVKTNQLQRIIRTGRTGHWLNHGKEHCLVGMKGNPKINRGLDCDVIVAEVRATSHKPDEIYGIIERLSPGTRKLELFGRQHNVQPNWVTLGNQLDGVNLLEDELIKSFKERYPDGICRKPSTQ